jgi:hypothetical protein
VTRTVDTFPHPPYASHRVVRFSRRSPTEAGSRRENLGNTCVPNWLSFELSQARKDRTLFSFQRPAKPPRAYEGLRWRGFRANEIRPRKPGSGIYETCPAGSRPKGAGLQHFLPIRTSPAMGYPAPSPGSCLPRATRSPLHRPVTADQWTSARTNRRLPTLIR